MAVTCSSSGVADLSSTTVTVVRSLDPASSGPLRSIRPTSSDRSSPFSTTRAIRTPSAATRTARIRPSSPGVRTCSGWSAPCGSR